MANKTNYWVSPMPDGRWKAQKEGSQRAAGIFDTQKQAEDLARQILCNNNGGELITQRPTGEIRSKDTINASDPFPPRDAEF